MYLPSLGFTILAAVSAHTGSALAMSNDALSRRGENASATAYLLDQQALASEALQLSTQANSSCNNSTLQLRRDWDYLSTDERKNYISALQCLLTSPSKVNSTLFPGARNRYDDFAAVHINQTLIIHGTGNFLTWHRYFTWAYEQALRNECGYEGYAPYWNWFTHAGNMTASPVLDGSDTSLSGDGSYVEHNGSDPLTNLHLASGNGGGCVTQGPLVNMTVNLGPWYPTMDTLAEDPSGEFGYNPRCLRRDLLNDVSAEIYTLANLVNLTTGLAAQTMTTFQTELWGRFDDVFLGVHTTGHVAVSGDQSSVYSSIVDPLFFLHHSMVDRIYWIWQMLHPDLAGEIAGTITPLNTPASRDAVLTDLVYLDESMAPPKEIQELLSTTAGPFCYAYV